MTADSSVDLLIVGGGLAGLATARLLALRLPGLSILVVEKRAEDRAYLAK